MDVCPDCGAELVLITNRDPFTSWTKCPNAPDNCRNDELKFESDRTPFRYDDMLYFLIVLSVSSVSVFCLVFIVSSVFWT